MTQKRNLVEKLIGWIPGYKGYNARETRRDTDRLLREAIVRSLDRPRTAIDEAIADASRRQRFDHIESLELLRRTLSTAADRLRLAPAGYSGFFDASKVDVAELDAIQEHDERLRELAERIGSASDGLRNADETSIDAVRGAIADLENALRARDDLVKGLGD
ncbi:MAG TPA: hypothetical protein PKC43_11405 [Phycisphaerales bacterium]|nr:hypothetical protein [Phycisphaerales bacterium]HMP38038.1 hypothetical protein [Phycisphaerales bacterium]